jgi:hypothetical protein
MSTAIYRKTERGLLEMSSRERRLTPRLRSALILIDGKKLLRDLQVLLGPQYVETLQILEDLGLIEAIEPIRIVDPEPLAPVAPVARPLSSREVEAIRRHAVRWLAERMGPYADGINLKIEKCKSADELLASLRLGHTIVAQQLGAPTAEQFHAEFIEMTASV